MTLADVKARLARGDYIHMQYRDGQREWWFEPGEGVPDDFMQIIQASGEVVEAGDSLFGFPTNSQT